MVLVLATWTIVYHLALLLSLGVVVAAALEVLVLAGATLGWAWVRRRDRPGSPPGTSVWASASMSRGGPLDRRWVAFTVAAAAVSATAMAVDAPWLLVWTSWLAAAAAGTWCAWRRTARPTDATAATAAHEPDAAPSVDPAADGEPGRWETVTALGAALAAAAFPLWTLRSNPDDLFYVSISQWVAEHGSFPLRDTLFSDQALPAVNWPPVASYDGLVGAIAHLAGGRAGTVEYLVVPPVASFLAVVALWQLLRAWRLRRVAVALGGALVFLLLDGTSSYATPGNLFVTRLWQGKVILLCVLVPVMLVRAVQHIDHTDRAFADGRDTPSARTTLGLFLAGVASVGLSTSAMFLTPLVALAGMAPALRRTPRVALTGFAALAGYPLAAGVVTFALGGRSADDFGSRRLYRFDPAWFGHQIFLTGLVAAVGVLSVLLGALLVPHPAARVTTGLLVTMTGLTFVPGTTHLAYRLTGLGPTLWRVSWACTVGALVGVAVAWLLGRMRVRWAVVTAALATVVLAVSGHPIWGSGTNTSFKAPFHWQRSDSTREVAARLIAVNRPGDLVLAPSGLAITLVVTDTDVRNVAPRGYAMDRLRNVASFHYAERLVLVRFVGHLGDWRLPRVARALRVLDVSTVCVSGGDVLRAEALHTLGYRPLIDTVGYRCFRR
jgi:hypothetical protein